MGDAAAAPRARPADPDRAPPASAWAAAGAGRRLFGAPPLVVTPPAPRVGGAAANAAGAVPPRAAPPRPAVTPAASPASTPRDAPAGEEETRPTEAEPAAAPSPPPPSTWAALAARRASPPPAPPRRPSMDGTPTDENAAVASPATRSPELENLVTVPASPLPPPPLGRRPLANAGNTCFMGATLQALLALPPFGGLVAAAAGVGAAELRRKRAPVLAALADLGEALALPSSSAQPGDLLAGPALAVDCLLPTLARFGGAAARAAAAARGAALAAASGRGRGRGPAARRPPPSSQEDAQEYLVHLLDAAHSELVALAGASRGAARAAVPSTTPPPDDDGGWVTAGRTRRDAAVTRGSTSVAGGASRVAAAFAGALRSEVRAGGGARPSATLQPFTVLSLDVADASVDSVEAALDAFVRPEGVEGYRPAPGAPPRRALKTLSLADPPPCLVLHLCRFAYGSATGSGKLHKRLPAPMDLRLRAGWLARGGGGDGRRHRSYRLAAAVFHHGASAGAGHYTAAVEARGADGASTWLEFDDAAVRRVRGDAVAGDGGAYLLFYRAAD